MTALERVGFVTYPQSRWRQVLIKAKYLKMRLERNIYPDVYALPLFVVDSFEMIPMGSKVAPGSYQLIFSELNGTLEQISYLRDVVRNAGSPVAVIPGPPAILGGVLDSQKLDLVRDIVRESRYLLAYSEDIAAFFDGIAGSRRSLLIPWPFDYGRTRALGATRSPSSEGRVRILFNAPLRLTGSLAGFYLGMKAVLADILAGLSPADRARITFHTFVYSDADRAEYAKRGFADSFPLRLERKRGYAAFLRFLGSMSAVMHFAPSGVLGRIAFGAAALELPGLFSNNVELHRELYPGATLAAYDMIGFREAAERLVTGVTAGRIDAMFNPDLASAARVGDFASNAARFRQLLELQ